MTRSQDSEKREKRTVTRNTALPSIRRTCTVQYSTVQYSTAQYSIVQHSTVQDGTWPAGMEQMLMAAMTRLLKAPEPMIRLDPSSSFRNPLDTIPRIVRKI